MLGRACRSTLLVWMVLVVLDPVSWTGVEAARRIAKLAPRYHYEGTATTTGTASTETTPPRRRRRRGRRRRNLAQHAVPTIRPTAA